MLDEDVTESGTGSCDEEDDVLELPGDANEELLDTVSLKTLDAA